MLASILVGVISSVIASLLFLYLFLAKKVPIIEIAPFISKESDDKGGYVYWFKYVNKTDYPIYNVQVEAYFLTPIGSDGGTNLKITDLNVKHTTYTHVPCKKKDDKNAQHAVQVRCLDDISGTWINQSSYLRFDVTAKHELSGFSKVFSKEFHNKNTSIKSGTFKFGDDLTIS